MGKLNVLCKLQRLLFHAIRYVDAGQVYVSGLVTNSERRVNLQRMSLKAEEISNEALLLGHLPHLS